MIFHGSSLLGRSEENHYHSSPFLASAVLHLVYESANYINENYQDELNWTEISDKFNIPLRTLNRKLQEHTGLTPNNYLGRVRLCHASYLLSHSQDAVTDIAFSCGFN
ncbi:MAG: helix-turn-helix domain-containing protein, partial [Tolumonas sp.]